VPHKLCTLLHLASDKARIGAASRSLSQRRVTGTDGPVAAGLHSITPTLPAHPSLPNFGKRSAGVVFLCAAGETPGSYFFASSSISLRRRV